MGRFDWNRIGRIGQERGEGGGGGREFEIYRGMSIMTAAPSL